jgi:hypothetical protein
VSFAIARYNKLRSEAQGRNCEIRVPGHCLPGNETVVGCHVRMIGVSGIGMKAPDFLIAYGCFACHQIVDGQRKSEFTAEQRRLMLLEGMVRTQVILYQEGKLSE